MGTNLNDIFNLEGKIAVITGASRGLASKASDYITRHSIVIDGG